MPCNCKSAGRMSGNPLCGLNERVCIETKKIFDGCIAKYSGVEFTVALTGITAGLTPPYTFVRMVSGGATTISDLVVQPIAGRRSRVTFNAATPVTVAFTDSTGAIGSGQGVVTVTRDVVLEIPQDSIVPYSIEATTSVDSRIGSFAADNATVATTGCLVQIVRVVATVDLLVPSYGYCEYPACEDYGDRECRGVFARPVFPPSD